MLHPLLRCAITFKRWLHRLARTAGEVAEDVVEEVDGGGRKGGNGDADGIVDHFPARPKVSPSPSPSDGSGSEVEEDIPEDC